jgi:hypothetical protein
VQALIQQTVDSSIVPEHLSPLACEYYKAGAVAMAKDIYSESLRLGSGVIWNLQFTEVLYQ